MQKLVYSIILIFGLNCCATIDTVSNLTSDSPKVYSGTRLDKTAISGERLRLKVYKDKFGIEPPENPKTDIFFSFILDTVLLPVTVPIALYEIIFE